MNDHNTKPRKRRAAIYRRISTNEARQTTGLTTQRDEIIEFASRHDLVIVDDFRDEITGTVLNRPGLDKAVDAARRGEFDVLLVHSADRLARDMLVAFTLVDQLTASGVEVRSTTETWDLGSPDGKMQFGLYAMFATLERDKLQERINRGVTFKKAEGKWITGGPPFGYTLDSERQMLVIHPEEAAIVRSVFEKVAVEKCGVTAVRSWLNDNGWRTSRGKQWSTPAVRAMLARLTYRGLIVHKEVVHEGLHDAIIDPDLWNAAQRVLERRANKTTQRVADSTYLLSGLLRCTACGGSYLAQKPGGTTKWRYYLCMNRIRRGSTGCDSASLPAAATEDLVSNLVIDAYANTDLFERAISQAAARVADRQPLIVERAATVSELATVTRAIEKYLRIFEAMDDAPFPIDRLKDLNVQKEQLARRVGEVESMLDAATPTVPTLRQLQEAEAVVSSALCGSPSPTSKAFLAEVIETIGVTPDRKLLPVLRVPQWFGGASSAHPRATSGGYTGSATSEGNEGARLRVVESSVELIGIEPTTSALQRQRSAN